MTKVFNGKTLKEVKEKALAIIDQERSGKQLGLLTPFPKLNIANGKYMRFGNVTCIAGGSGHGKTYLLNMLINSFINPVYNKNAEYEFVIPYHSFEMLPEDDMIRTLSSKVGKSYHNLLSSEYGRSGYNTVTDSDFEYFKSVLFDDKKEPPLYYYDVPCTVEQIKRNVKESIDYYREVNQTTSKPRAVIPIDHTLLIEQADNEFNVLDTMTSIAKAAIELKKLGHMVIFIGQLNNNIESTERIRNADLHYPMKSDIYAQAQIFNACDNVWTLHRPELLNILKYGRYKIDSNGLVHLQVVKARFGTVGSIWLKNELSQGRYVDYDEVQRHINNYNSNN